VKGLQDCTRMNIGARLMSRAELEIEYDQEMTPVSGMCTACREMMPKPPADIVNSADIILWFSVKFIEHRRLKHLRQREEIARGHIMERRDDMSGLIAMVQARRSTTIQ
jgi:hypothetical protein